jgi:hypothetical protein
MPNALLKDKTVVTLIDYEIVYDRLESEFTRNLPKEVDDQLPVLNKAIYSRPEKTIETLEYLKNKYGPLPILLNYLGASYMHAGQDELAEKYIAENYAKHPDYLFAKINYADLCLIKQKFNEIPKIFDYNFDLKLYCPHRDTFHISEFTGFYGIMCMYFYGIKDYKAAKTYYKILKQVAPGHFKTKQVKQMIYPSVFRLILNFFKHKIGKLNS